MQRASFRGLILLLPFILLTLCIPMALRAQERGVPQAQLEIYAKAYTAIGKLRDQYEAEFAEPRNKKAEAMQQLHEKLRQEVAKVIQDNGLTEQQYNQITWTLSTDPEARKAFDLLMGIAPPAPPPAAAPAGDRPANPHIGHVMTSFNGTPDNMGLLPVALAEARTVVQHATLAAQNNTSLDAMKQHAGHVIHAIDPAEVAAGPGPGYGLKKAASNLATHIELAAKAQGASQNITTHAVHIATAARNTVQRADQILAIARLIQAAGSAEEAAALVTKLTALTGQLMGGVDTNGDGKISWEEGEGGLQHVEQHMNLLLQGEGMK